MASVATSATNNVTVPSPPSFRFENNESTQSLLSRRGSDFGSRFSLSDGSGMYISSFALTIVVSSVATIGIMLATVIITLAVMLGSCAKRSHSDWHLPKPMASDYCASFQLNAEMNNIHGWTLPKLCEAHVSNYIIGGQYYADFAAAVNSARNYLKVLVTENHGRDVVVLDVDETALSNIPYYQDHHYGAEGLNNKDIWNQWVEEARAPALLPMLDLYKELRAANWSIIFITGRPEYQRNATVQNLLAAGYEGWSSLIFRSSMEVGFTAEYYKSSRRLELEKQGYTIRSCLGDQWSDILGLAVGKQTFKLPNPMYYIF